MIELFVPVSVSIDITFDINDYWKSQSVVLLLPIITNNHQYFLSEMWLIILLLSCILNVILYAFLASVVLEVVSRVWHTRQILYHWTTLPVCFFPSNLRLEFTKLNWLSWIHSVTQVNFEHEMLLLSLLRSWGDGSVLSSQAVLSILFNIAFYLVFLYQN